MNVIVTGANRGIGLELTRQCLARGDSVHAGARAPERARDLAALVEAARGRLRIHPCDVTLEPSVRSFAAAVTEPIDLLVNNAGVRNATRDDSLEQLDPEDTVASFQVNALGALRMTRALLPRLRRRPGEKGNARIANISSGLGSISDNTSGGGYGYRMSKAALNMASRSMAHDLRKDGILVVALSPGWVQTDMGGSGAPTPVEDSASGLLAVIDRLTMADTGSFLDFEGQHLTW